MNFLRKILLILALITLCDVHWGVMQLATWVEMAVESVAKEEALISSVYQSITGEKKCPRCCQIETERERNNDRSAQWESKNLGLNPVNKENPVPPNLLFEPFSFENEFGSARRDAPSSPPPWS